MNTLLNIRTFNFLLISLLGWTFHKQVECVGVGDNDELLTTVDIENPYVVSEVLTTTAVSCYVTPHDMTGDVITVTCPPGCDKVTEKLWGTRVYFEKSYICAAAIHDGRVSADDGGRVTFRKFLEDSYYTGSTSSNITSKSSSISNSSFVFLSAFEGRQSLYAVSCLAKADFTNEKEYLAVCPAGCQIQERAVWGTNLYTRESSICAAAIHAGKIEGAQGGRVIVRRRPAISVYHGTLRNGVQSQSYFNGTAYSILLEECPEDVSAVISVDCSLKAEHIYSDVFTVMCPPGCSDSYSEVTGGGPYSEDSTVCGAAVHDGIITDTLGGPVTVRKLSSVQVFRSVRRNGITSKASTSPARGIIMQSSIRDFPSLLTVNCRTPANTFHEKSFTVVCPNGCSSQAPVYGTTVYAGSSSICIAAVHAGEITAQHGGIVIVRKIARKRGFVGSIRNEVTSNDFDDIAREAFSLGGNLEEVNTALLVPCDFVVPAVMAMEFTVRCPESCVERYTEDVRSNWKKGVFDLFEPVCLSGSFADKTITVRRVPDTTVYVDSFEDFLHHADPQVIDSTYAGKYVAYVDDFDHPSILTISWEMETDMIHVDTSTVVCPPRHNQTTRHVWGTGVYTDNSHLCMAALHDGRITDDGGAVTVRKVGGLSAYEGTESNGYRSEELRRPWDTSIVFQNTFFHIAATVTASCNLRGYMIEDTNMKIVCPAGCAKDAVVFGNGIYSDESGLCAAAIHAGQITDAGGRIIARHLTSGRRFYYGSSANGIISDFFFEYTEAFTFL